MYGLAARNEINAICGQASQIGSESAKMVDIIRRYIYKSDFLQPRIKELSGFSALF